MVDAITGANTAGTSQEVQNTSTASSTTNANDLLKTLGGLVGIGGADNYHGNSLIVEDKGKYKEKSITKTLSFPRLLTWGVIGYLITQLFPKPDPYRYY